MDDETYIEAAQGNLECQEKIALDEIKRLIENVNPDNLHTALWSIGQIATNRRFNEAPCHVTRSPWNGEVVHGC